VQGQGNISYDLDIRSLLDRTDESSRDEREDNPEIIQLVADSRSSDLEHPDWRYWV